MHSFFVPYFQTMPNFTTYELNQFGNLYYRPPRNLMIIHSSGSTTCLSTSSIIRCFYLKSWILRESSCLQLSSKYFLFSTLFHFVPCNNLTIPLTFSLLLQAFTPKECIPPEVECYQHDIGNVRNGIRKGNIMADQNLVIDSDKIQGHHKVNNTKGYRDHHPLNAQTRIQTSGDSPLLGGIQEAQ